MKRILFVIFAALVSLSGCQKDKEPLRSIPATIKPYNNPSKVYVENHIAYWNDGDKVQINGREETVVVLSNNETSITLGTEYAENTTFYALYPSQEVTAFNGGSYSVTLPAIQEFEVEDGQQVIRGLMAAKGESSLDFENVTSLLCVKVPENTTVTCITVSASNNNGEVPLCGEGMVSFEESGASLGTLTPRQGNSVSLACNRANLSKYYVVVPAINNVRFTIDVAFLKDGKVCKDHVEQTTFSNTVPSNSISYIDLSSRDLGSTPAGVFTIDKDGNKVCFSQGNLQYIGSASPASWKFAENAYDVLGSAQDGNSEAIDRDLFGYGTSGWNSGIQNITMYQPYSTGSLYSNYYPNNLDGTQADWGLHNTITNGGSQAGVWHTPKNSDWSYIIGTRTGSRYVNATIGNVKGLMLLPNNYSQPPCISLDPNSINDGSCGFDLNTYSIKEWVLMEANGAVFLPTGGNRSGTTVSNVNTFGYYWSATKAGSSNANSLVFGSNSVIPTGTKARYYGFAVRLVQGTN